MRHRLAAPVALIGAAALFALVFAMTGSYLLAPVLAFAAGIGVYLMIDDRSPVEVASDDYAEDAEAKVAQVVRSLRTIEKLAGQIQSPTARAAIADACQYVPELISRVREKSPNSLYSTASQIGGHLRSLEASVSQYQDIERKPMLYRDPAALRTSGEQAFRRFADFALDSVRLVNDGDIAQYRANLETVAPPALPEFGQP